MAVSSADFRALAEVRYRIRCFLNFSTESARGAGLEPQQHQLLLALRGLPSDLAPTIGALAERLQIQHNSAVELVRRSVERGLLTKRTSDRDRREILVELTPEGTKLLESLAVAHRTELRSTGPALLVALSALLGDGKTA
jgi:DNA-binding MarR family transcriptional regulator